MDTRIFFSTFILIFLAELGDKTQLAALAAGAGSRSTWSVFAGAATALVFSTLVAVLLGNALQRVLPLSYIRLAAGGFFVIAGILLIISTMKQEAPAAESQSPAPSQTSPAGRGIVTRIAVHAAVNFEQAVLERYSKMADRSRDPSVRKLFARLAREERQHLAALHNLACDHTHEFIEELPPCPADLQDSTPSSREFRQVLGELIQHEHQAAKFFAELAVRIPLPALKRSFQTLAKDEERHARELAGLPEHPQVKEGGRG